MKNNITYIMLLLGTIGFSQNWKTNFEDAKNQAIIENKNMVVVFSI
jgi:hypothetical protein